MLTFAHREQSSGGWNPWHLNTSQGGGATAVLVFIATKHLQVRKKMQISCKVVNTFIKSQPWVHVFLWCMPKWEVHIRRFLHPAPWASFSGKAHDAVVWLASELATRREQQFKRMTCKHSYSDLGVWYPFSKGKQEGVCVACVKNSSFQATIRVLENLCGHRGWTFLMSLVVTVMFWHMECVNFWKLCLTQWTSMFQMTSASSYIITPVTCITQA